MCVARTVRCHPLFSTVSRKTGAFTEPGAHRHHFRPPRSPRPHPVPGLQSHVALFGFYVGAGDSNWGPHAYAAGTMEPRSSLKPLNLKINPWLRLGLPANLGYCAYFFDHRTRGMHGPLLAVTAPPPYQGPLLICKQRECIQPTLWREEWPRARHLPQNQLTQTVPGLGP